MSTENPLFTASSSVTIFHPQPEVLCSARSHATNPLKLAQRCHRPCDCVPLPCPPAPCTARLPQWLFLLLSKSSSRFLLYSCLWKYYLACDLNYHLCLDESQISPSPSTTFHSPLVSPLFCPLSLSLFLVQNFSPESHLLSPSLAGFRGPHSPCSRPQRSLSY